MNTSTSMCGSQSYNEGKTRKQGEENRNSISSWNFFSFLLPSSSSAHNPPSTSRLPPRFLHPALFCTTTRVIVLLLWELAVKYIAKISAKKESERQKWKFWPERTEQKKIVINNKLRREKKAFAYANKRNNDDIVHGRIRESFIVLAPTGYSIISNLLTSSFYRCLLFLPTSRPHLTQEKKSAAAANKKKQI